MKRLFLCFLVLTSFWTSCNSDDEMQPGTNEPLFNEGLFVINEGPFQTGSGSITYYHRDSQEVFQKVFQQQNDGAVLGNIVQSMYIHEGRAYIVVNNADKIEVVDAQTFQYLATIEGLELPRYFLPISSTKAYVSQWGSDGISGSIAILDLEQLRITQTIPCGQGTQALILHQDLVYAANQGGFGDDSTIVALNPQSDQIINRISLGDNPQAFIIDRKDELWVLSRGFNDYLPNGLRRPGRLSHLFDGAVEESIEVPVDASHLVYDAERHKILYTHPGGIHAISLDNLLATPEVFSQRVFYGLNLDREQNLIYAADARQFQSAGIIIVYDLDGVAVDSFETGIIPNGVWVL
ncbi:MAG: DUF5074 domain-containing protein [Bacteroidota bacterium]